MNSTERPLVAILDPSVDVTGALNAARREARLLRDKTRFLLILPEASRIGREQLPEFDEVIYLPFPRLKRSLGAMAAYLPSVVGAARRLARELHARRCATLQVNDFYLAHGVLAGTFGFAGPIITWVRMDPSAFGKALGPALLALAAERSTHLVAVSQVIAELLPSAKVAKVVYDAVPEVDVRPAGTLTQRLVLIGNYIAGKGHDVAIRAFAQIAGVFPAAELTFHGSDMGLARNRAYRDGLTMLAAELGVSSQVGFGEFLPEPADALRSALCALCLSSRESFSLVTQEASALGLPVIATRCGGPEEIINDGETGWLVPVGDVDAVAAAMRQALEQPAKATAMGIAGAARVRAHFAPEKFKRQVGELLGL